MNRRVFVGLAIGTVVVLAGTGAFAMKPAPFEKVTHVDPTSKVRLVSVPDDGMADGTTRVFDAKGKELWSMPEIVGRHRIRLSPDGGFLLLTGNFYFGTSFHLEPDEPVASIYERGKLLKQFTFADISTIDPETSAKERKLAVMGGNWVELKDFITNVDVDWKARTITVHLFDGSAAKRSF